jgi:hypothetical protein
MELAELIGAVASYVTECGGAPTKTKVLKLLYLLDIDTYRRTNQTLTGFDWIFYLYGPWAASYDDALSDAAHTEIIRIVAPEAGDEGATFINPVQRLPLARVFPSFVQELGAKRIIEAWASKPVVELLDYVYFHTAPMRDATRGAALDFSTVSNEESFPHYFGIKSKPTEVKEINRKRRQFLDSMKLVRKAQIAPLDPPPQYDDIYQSAVSKLESEFD